MFPVLTFNKFLFLLASQRPVNQTPSPECPVASTVRVDQLCGMMDCGDNTCRVVTEGCADPPVAVCLSGDRPVPADIDAVCQNNDFLEAVLSGDPAMPNQLEPLSCNECPGALCPNGAVCVTEGSGNGVCCQISLAASFGDSTLRADRLCDMMDCGDNTCRVVIEECPDPPMAVCLPSGDLPLVLDVTCRVNGFRDAVLAGDPGMPDQLMPLSCGDCPNSICPNGATCLMDDDGNSVCCLNDDTCNEAVLQDIAGNGQFEYEGRTYSLIFKPDSLDDIFENSICNIFGGYLAEVETQEEDNAIRQNLASLGISEGVLISGNDRDVEGTFVYVNSGRQIRYDGFMGDQPDNSGQCIYLVPDGNGGFLWDDNECVGLEEDFNIALCEVP